MAPAWLDAFQNAVDAANLEITQELIAQIAGSHPTLSRKLADLVDEYRFDTLQALIGARSE